jgi:hypothetical protein
MVFTTQVSAPGCQTGSGYGTLLIHRQGCLWILFFLTVMHFCLPFCRFDLKQNIQMQLAAMQWMELFDGAFRSVPHPTIIP